MIIDDAAAADADDADDLGGRPTMFYCIAFLSKKSMKISVFGESKNDRRRLLVLSWW